MAGRHPSRTIRDEAKPDSRECIEEMPATSSCGDHRDSSPQILRWMWLAPRAGVVVIGRMAGTDSNSCPRRGRRRSSDAGRPNSIQSVAVWYPQPLAHRGRLPFRFLGQRVARCPAGTASSAARSVLTMGIPGGYANSKQEQYAEPGCKVIWGGCKKASNCAEACEQALDLEKRDRLYKRMSSDKTSRQEAGCAASSFRA